MFQDLLMFIWLMLLLYSLVDALIGAAVTTAAATTITATTAAALIAYQNSL